MLKRTILYMVLAAILVLALAVPAFAAPRNETAPNCARGQFTAAFDQDTLSGLVKHLTKGVEQCGGDIM